MLASGVATTAWHLGRSGGSAADVTVASGTVAVPQPVPPASSAAVTRSAPKPPAPVRHRVRAEDPVPPSTSSASRSAAVTPPAPTRAPRVEARRSGPKGCVRTFHFDVGSPLIAEPCHAAGAHVQMSGALTAPDGGRASITVALQENGRTVAGPLTCPGLAFNGDGMSTRECGPKRAVALRGHRYTVLMTWTYSRDGRTGTGQARGSEFTF